ncbi:MAG TPA: ATP synthase F0 subunit B [Candidatus Moranbacteria bacterium]|nr:MAG: ATP synthase subunit b [Candidatus Moranbacteria bacterium GW2011_GWF1_34_10]HBI17589.1 ATP synthase F0 subunit B [Candidatus Moranbacteria bacterium]
MELLQNLGINGKLVLAQIVNFFILFYVLKKFAYGPVLKMLDDRSKKIEKGMKDAEASSKKLVEIEEKEKEVLTNAKKEAQEIIKKAEEQGMKNKEAIMVEAKEQADVMLKKAQEKIEEEKNKVMAEVKNEVAGLVMLATEKIVGEKMNSENDKKIIEEIIK